MGLPSPNDGESKMTLQSNRFGFVIALSCGIAACGNSSDVPPGGSSNALDEQSIGEIEALAEHAVEEGIPGVSIAMLRDGQTVTITRGVSALGTSDPLSPEYRFRMASIAKTFVASIVLQLASEGDVALTDTVEDVLPGQLHTNQQATLEQLVRQQSGIFDFAEDQRLMAPYFDGNFGYSWSPDALLALANDHPANFTPGERFEYSNTNFLLLAMVAERVTGSTIAELVRERIVEPLGLTATSFETGSSMEAPFARGYLVGMGDPVDVTDISGSALYGCGNLVSTPLDVAHFYRALVAGEVVSKAQLPAMFDISPSVPDAPYAMGVFRSPRTVFPCGDFIGHPGDTPGYNVIGYSSRDGHRQFAMSINSLTMDDKSGSDAAQQAYLDLAQAIACK